MRVACNTNPRNELAHLHRRVFKHTHIYLYIYILFCVFLFDIDGCFIWAGVA